MNKHFVIYDSSGKILRAGDVPEEYLSIQTVREGEFFLEGEANVKTDAVDPITGTIIKGGNPNPNPPPPIQEPQSPGEMSTRQQLDLLWQAMDSGTFPKAEPFYSAIKATKT